MLGTDQFFIQVAAIIIPFVVGGIKMLAERRNSVWIRVNQPTVAALCGALLGALYHIDAVYRGLHGVSLPATATLADFILGGITAGFAASGLRSFVKDMTSGAITATTPADIAAMRTPEVHPSEVDPDNIGE